MADTEMVQPVRIGNHVWIGARAVVLKGVTVGDGAVIGAGAVVTQNVPPNTMVAGVPARAIRDEIEWW
jgi:acetyltransferase-like isoleucine patch superfamily enzyme